MTIDPVIHSCFLLNFLFQFTGVPAGRPEQDADVDERGPVLRPQPGRGQRGLAARRRRLTRHGREREGV